MVNRIDKDVASFPEELPYRLIKLYSYVGETVLDPFLGSGTTTKVARMLGRNSIGYEINEDLIPVIKKKVGYEQKSLTEDNVEIIVRNEATEMDTQ